MKPKDPSFSTDEDISYLDKPLWRLALPVMASMTCSALYNLIDGMFVASVGEEALTAVTLASPVQLAMIALATGTGVGITASISRYQGEDDKGSAIRCRWGALLLALAYFTLTLIFSLGGTEAFMDSVGARDSVNDYGYAYLSLICRLSLGYYIEVASESILLASGHSKLVMTSQLTGARLNVLLDFLLVPGMLGLPAMGVEGAALATITSQTIAALLSLAFNISSGFKPIEKAHRSISLCFAIASILRVGLPSTSIQLASSISAVFLNSILLGCSPECVAAYGAYLRIQSLFFMPVYGLANALVPMVSYRFWSADNEGLRRIWRSALRIGIAIMGMACVVFWAFAPQLAILFTLRPSSVELYSIAFKALSTGLAFAAVCALGNSVLQACGKAGLSLALTLIRLFGVMLPLAFVFAAIYGEQIVWWVPLVSDALFAAITVWAVHVCGGIKTPFLPAQTHTKAKNR